MKNGVEKIFSIRDVIEVQRVRKLVRHEACMACVPGLHDGTEWAFARKNGPRIGSSKRSAPGPRLNDEQATWIL